MKIERISNKLYKEDTRRWNEITKNSVKCTCGHSVLIGSYGRKICSHCGKWVFKDKLEEFKYRIREKGNK